MCKLYGTKRGKKAIFIFWIFKTPSKKKKRTRAPGFLIGGQKKEEFRKGHARKGHAAKRDARRPKTRSKRSRTERSTIATPAFRRFFFPSLCFHPLRAERLAREKKEREHFKGVSPYSPFELSLRKTRFVCLCEYI